MDEKKSWKAIGDKKKEKKKRRKGKKDKVATGTL